MQTLSPSDIERFWRDGFLVLDGVFSSEEVEALREACSAPEDRQWETSDRTVHSLDLTARHPAFLTLARDPRVTGRLVPLLGPDLQLQHSKLAAKPPVKDAGPFGWHQDFAYFPHTNTSLAAVMVMLDDATPENGAMQMVRGSYKLGLLNHVDESGTFTGNCLESHVWEERPEEIVSITPRAGGISIHHCLTLHGSPPNRSGQPRRGLVFQYRADDAYQLADGVWADTGLLVCGEKRERVRCDAGVLRLPKSNRYPGHPFGTCWNQEGAFAREVNGRA
jgi:ectoine hydroxylase-related dioxygenase (phytanoyl-CoA dioxygenase family)